MSRGVRAAVVTSAAGLLVVVIGAAVLADNDGNGIAAGLIYSTDNGDPIDVFYGPGDMPGTGCMNVGRLSYSRAGANCFDVKDIDEGGTYQLVLLGPAEKPAIVVGIMPAGATGVTVGGVGRRTTRAETRGRWFLASLQPATPSVLNLATIHVEFDP